MRTGLCDFGTMQEAKFRCAEYSTVYIFSVIQDWFALTLYMKKCLSLYEVFYFIPSYIAQASKNLSIIYLFSATVKQTLVKNGPKIIIEGIENPWWNRKKQSYIGSRIPDAFLQGNEYHDSQSDSGRCGREGSEKPRAFF